MKRTALSHVSVSTIRKANSALVRSKGSLSRFLSDHIELKSGGRTKVISTHIESDKIKEAWGKAVKN